MHDASSSAIECRDRNSICHHVVSANPWKLRQPDCNKLTTPYSPPVPRLRINRRYRNRHLFLSARFSRLPCFPVHTPPFFPAFSHLPSSIHALPFPSHSLIQDQPSQFCPDPLPRHQTHSHWSAADRDPNSGDHQPFLCDNLEHPRLPVVYNLSALLVIIFCFRKQGILHNGSRRGSKV